LQALEQALHLVSKQLAEVDPGNLLASELRIALGDYGLGETIETSLGRMADGIGVEEVRTLVTGISQGKRLGAGMEMILRDQELLVAHGPAQPRRRRRLADFHAPDGEVLVGVYLPEFVILVMVPLFWGLMLRAFG
jgi:pilus assembly protein TadC